MSQNHTLDTSNANGQLALSVARRAMKIVIFIGMLSVILLMINIYILLNQITATAQISREIKVIKQILQLEDSSLEVSTKLDSSLRSSIESSTQTPSQAKSSANSTQK